jgi:hypothetical protein
MCFEIERIGKITKIDLTDNTVQIDYTSGCEIACFAWIALEELTLVTPEPVFLEYKGVIFAVGDKVVCEYNKTPEGRYTVSSITSVDKAEGSFRVSNGHGLSWSQLVGHSTFIRLGKSSETHICMVKGNVFKAGDPVSGICMETNKRVIGKYYDVNENKFKVQIRTINERGYYHCPWTKVEDLISKEAPKNDDKTNSGSFKGVEFDLADVITYDSKGLTKTSRIREIDNKNGRLKLIDDYYSVINKDNFILHGQPDVYFSNGTVFKIGDYVSGVCVIDNRKIVGRIKKSDKKDLTILLECKTSYSDHVFSGHILEISNQKRIRKKQKLFKEEKKRRRK